MMSLSRWKIFFVLFISLIGIVASLPPLIGPEKLAGLLPHWFPQRALTLGLDLQGGAHLLLEVDREKLLTDRYSVMLDSVRKALRKERIGYTHLVATPSGITFILRDPQQQHRIQELIGTLDPQLTLDFSGGRLRVFWNELAQGDILKRAVEKSIETIRRRVDETGTKEPLIQPQGSGRIILQVPGVEHPERIKQLIGKTARLSFQLVERVLSPQEAQDFTPPPGTEVCLSEEKQDPAAPQDRPNSASLSYLVNKEVILSGDMLVDSQPSFGEYQQPQVSFVFNSMGAARFGDATRDNVGKPFAIILDGKVISAPNIREPILNGAGVISGNFSLQEAQDLSLLMRSGALPAPLAVLEERTVGPGLGADSIAAGAQATFFAVIAVGILIFASYSAFGGFANVAMVFNIFLLVASLAFLGATLTLPGIAGIALTMGMAVDANVLINERIKEELRLGRRLIPAIDMGYQRAMGTIVDSNLTTLIGACLLYYFGTGPVRGFAVTLSLGILISMFTAVSLSRIFVILWLKWIKPQKAWL